MRALRTTTRVTATLAAASVMTLAAGPALAADPTIVAQSEAEAIYLAIGGQALTDELGGPFRAERTEDGETTEGNNEPRASLITGQDSIAAGTLAQDAQTGLAGNQGVSEACSGVAGAGSSFVGAGEEGRCLTPGRNAEIKLTPDGIDLEQLLDVELVGGTGGSLGGIIRQLPGLSDPVRVIIDQLNDNLDDALARLGNPGLFASLGAITSQCEAGPGETASGDAELTDVDVFLRLPSQFPGQRRVNLLDLKTSYPPNTKVVTQLSDVVDPILDGVLDSLGETGLPQPVIDGLDQVKEQIREQLLRQIEDQLGPVEENLLDGTLNKQTRAPGEIEVTAIDLAVLPVLQPQAGFNAVDLRLARSQCGPGDTLDTTVPTDPDDPNSPDVPRFVPAGDGGTLGGTAATGFDSTGPAAIALLALMTFGSAIGFSTSRSRVKA